MPNTGDRYNLLLQEIQKMLQGFGIEALLSDEQEIVMLKARFEGLGRAKGSALMEICVPAPAFSGLNGEPLAVLQVYTTLASNMDEANINPALTALNSLNAKCALGSLHLYIPQRQLFHRFNHLLCGEKLENFRVEALNAVNLVAGIINSIFDEAITIADDASRYKNG